MHFSELWKCFCSLCVVYRACGDYNFVTMGSNWFCDKQINYVIHETLVIMSN